MVTIGSIVTVHKSYHEYGADCGYLFLDQGDQVFVNYVGQTSQEADWLFGTKTGTTTQGWFPQDVVLAPQKQNPQSVAIGREPATNWWRGGAEDRVCQATAGGGAQQNVPAAQAQEKVATTICSADERAFPKEVVRKDEKENSAPPLYPTLQQDQQASDVESSDASSPSIGLPESGWATQPRRQSARSEVRKGICAGEHLPVANMQEELTALSENNRVVVMDAATGSGKSTLVPLFLLESCLERNRDCRIVVTQPRRMAAKGLANHVSRQCGTRPGELVGFRMGGAREDYGAMIVYVTVGHLLEALVHNPHQVDSYTHIILDEVHERFVEADFLMALLRLLLSRPETARIRIIVMSATLQNSLMHFFGPLMLPCPSPATAAENIARATLPSKVLYSIEERSWDDLAEQWKELTLHIAKVKFQDRMPSRICNDKARNRSRMLAEHCKDLAKVCARLLCLLHREHCSGPKGEAGTPDVALVFVPGLDAMRDLNDEIFNEVYSFFDYGYAKRMNLDQEVILMHSTFEEETYAHAHQPADPFSWRIVLATSIAESSVTIPGVTTVIDYGLHRVEVYDDETRMSVLSTEWCSKASMRQRRGRTGRTNDGQYVKLFPAAVEAEVPEFDESSVQRAPLTRLTLRAAHLAKLFVEGRKIHAGFPIKSAGIVDGSADYFDMEKQKWHVSADVGHAPRPVGLLPEAALRPGTIETRHILSVLPNPPKEFRVLRALMELHELGAIDSADAPTVIGTACLQVPLDVPLSRLVVLGGLLGCCADAAVMAAALSMTPSCDIFRSPRFNLYGYLESEDIRILASTVRERKAADDGAISEPLMMWSLFFEWLNSDSDRALGRAPGRGLSWSDLTHKRLWPSFQDKVVEVVESMQRVLPWNDPQREVLARLLRRMGRESRVQVRRQLRASDHRDDRKVPQAPVRQLQSLLALALGTTGWVAVGQTPSIYGTSSYDAFAGVVHKNTKMYEGQRLVQDPQLLDRAMVRALRWPAIKPEAAKEVVDILNAKSGETLGQAWAEQCEGETYVGLRVDAAPSSQQLELSAGAALLCRLCGPFNGKEAILKRLKNSYDQVRVVRPPRHPCTMNWYLPIRDGRGMLEVRVGWKSQADSLLHLPRPGDALARSRPKHFLVAGSAEFQGQHRVLRGVTVLPAEDGGRTALMWLLASGVPRMEKFVTYTSPRSMHRPDDFEVRAIRIWDRTLWLPAGSALTGYDLRTVNEYRESLLNLQARLPHELAGRWEVVGSAEPCCIECISKANASNGEPAEELYVIRGSSLARLEWYGDRKMAVVVQPETVDPEVVISCRLEHSTLIWSDGTRWVREDREGRVKDDRGEIPTLSQLSDDAREKFREAAEQLLDASGTATHAVGEDNALAGYPGRLLPLTLTQHQVGKYNNWSVPFDLDALQEKMIRHAGEVQQWISSGLWDPEEDIDPHDRQDEDEILDLSHQDVSEPYMWRLAEKPSWNIEHVRNTLFMEDALAVPIQPVCALCGLEDQKFSKRQLTRHPDERMCMECASKEQLTPSMPPQATIDRHTNGSAGGQDGQAPVTPVCSVCKVRLHKENCSSHQKKWPAHLRRCKTCVHGDTSPGAGAGA